MYDDDFINQAGILISLEQSEADPTVFRIVATKCGISEKFDVNIGSDDLEYQAKIIRIARDVAVDMIIRRLGAGHLVHA